ncbi:hypothetical protein THIOSC15_2460004 [uncultured Thiomicrorhabdus sp.]
MKASPSKLLAAIFMSSTLVGCSSTIKLEEPPKAQLDSELTMDLQWQIEQQTCRTAILVAWRLNSQPIRYLLPTPKALSRL